MSQPTIIQQLLRLAGTMQARGYESKANVSELFALANALQDLTQEFSAAAEALRMLSEGYCSDEILDGMDLNEEYLAEASSKLAALVPQD